MAKDKHTKTDGDDILRLAKERRAEEIERMRAADPMLADIVPADWVARETGFPPYLPMRAGLAFRVQILDRDDTDEFIDRDTGEVRPFVRYHLKLIAPMGLECRRGPNDERGEVVPVLAGQIFTIGEFKTLEREMKALMGLEAALICRKETKFKDRQTDEPRTRYDFDLMVSQETERMLVSENSQDQAFLRDAYRQARRLALTNKFRLPALTAGALSTSPATTAARATA